MSREKKMTKLYLYDGIREQEEDRRRLYEKRA